MLADQLTKAAGEGRLLVYSTHEQERAQLEQTSLDYVQVIATNGTDLEGATLDGQELLVTGADAQGHAVFAFNVTVLAGQTRHDRAEPNRAGDRRRARADATTAVGARDVSAGEQPALPVTLTKRRNAWIVRREK